MSRAQRLTFLAIAAVIAVVAVVLITRGDATTDTAGTPTPSATPSTSQQEASPGEPDATQTPEPTPTPKPIKTLKGGKLTKLKVTQGDTVRFRATADQPQEIHVHGYDIHKDIEAAGDTVTFSFKASITGVFEIEYEQLGEQIGQLSVEPK